MQVHTYVYDKKQKKKNYTRLNDTSTEHSIAGYIIANNAIENNIRHKFPHPMQEQ